MIRPAAVAGAFYPAEARVLLTEVDGFIEEATALPQGRLRALVVPHAGYAFSGPVAAQAYGLLKRVRPAPQRVLLLGPSHRHPLHGLGLSTAEAWDSPLGPVKLDLGGAQHLREQGLAHWADEAHAWEHSLEVQLPFLQSALPGLSLLPVAVGESTAKEVAALLRAAATPGTLVVVSTDLSHFLGYEEARRADAETDRHVLALDPDALEHESACGFYGLRGLLHFAREQGWDPRRLDLRNSGDTAGDKRKVVGYGAWAFEGGHGA